MSASSASIAANEGVEVSRPSDVPNGAEPVPDLKQRPTHVSWQEVEGGAGPVSAGIGYDAPPPPPTDVVDVNSFRIAVTREDYECPEPPPEALARCRTDADREQLRRYYRHRASIVSLGRIGMPPVLANSKLPLTEAAGRSVYNALVKSLLLRTSPPIACGLLLVAIGGLFCAYGEIIQLGVEGYAPAAKAAWLLGTAPTQKYGLGILGVANENQPLYYRLIILAGCIMGGTGVFVLVASISYLVDRLLAGRVLVRKRVQQRVQQRAGGQQTATHEADETDESKAQPEAVPPDAQPEPQGTQPEEPPAGTSPERLPAEKEKTGHESESAAYVPGAEEPAESRGPWNPEAALGEHSRSNSSDNTRVSPAH